MTMPKFEAVAWRYELKAGEYTFAEKRYFDEAYVQRVIALHTAEQLAGAYEAGKRDASEDLEQAAFEKWLYDKCPSGDVESVQRQWLRSYEYAEFAGKLEQAANEIESLRQQLASTEANQANIEATHRITLRDVQRETMRVQTENDTLRQQLVAANVLIAEQNKLAKERQEWALHTNEVIRSLNQQLAFCQAALADTEALEIGTGERLAKVEQQLAAALAACQLKDSALENITVVPPGLVTTSHDMRRIAQSALASQLDNQALEQFAAKVRAQCAKACDAQADHPECPERAVYCAEAIRAIKELP